MMDPEFPGGTASPRQFNSTHWSVVLLAGQAESPQSSEALEKLCRTYWFPLYLFVRRQGHNPEDAQDLTQKFFARLLERRDFETVAPGKGKFRTFLLAALPHFLANEKAGVDVNGMPVIGLEAERIPGSRTSFYTFHTTFCGAS